MPHLLATQLTALNARSAAWVSPLKHFSAQPKSGMPFFRQFCTAQAAPLRHGWLCRHCTAAGQFWKAQLRQLAAPPPAPEVLTLELVMPPAPEVLTLEPVPLVPVTLEPLTLEPGPLPVVAPGPTVSPELALTVVVPVVPVTPPVGPVGLFAPLPCAPVAPPAPRSNSLRAPHALTSAPAAINAQEKRFICDESITFGRSAQLAFRSRRGRRSLLPSMFRARVSALLAPALLAVASCDNADVCAPGRAVPCACPGGSQGVQTCRDDGRGFDRCECINLDAGFVDATKAAGVVYHQQAPFDPPTNCLEPTACQLNILTGGAAVGDYDNDGWPDLFVTAVGGAPVLFHNRGDGTFADATAGAGLAQKGNTNGAAWADIDNDGDVDLYVVTIGHGRNYLYVNDGKGHFTEEAAARGAALDDGEIHAAISVAAGDYDRDGFLDLHVAEWGAKGTGDQGFLDPQKPGHTRLFHNLGKKSPGHFEDATVAANAQLDAKKPDGTYASIFSYANAFVDFDGDDWPDLAVTGDFRTSQFLWNQGGGKFLDGTLTSGVAKDTFGMGSAIGDLDGDGKLDWFVTSISNGPTCVLGLCNSGEIGNHLYRYTGNRHFDDSSEKLGINVGYWGWGAEMFDFDNDGDLDLVMTNGTDYPFVPPSDFFTRDPMRFWRNDGGKMVESSQKLGLTDTRKGKGLVTFDYDHDGDLDLFIVNNADTPVLYRNDTHYGGWLRVRVLTADGRDALGAKLTLTAHAGDKPRVTEIGLGSHFLSQSETIAHFGLGLGNDPVYQLKVHWSDTGKEQVLNNLARNTLVVVKP